MDRLSDLIDCQAGLRGKLVARTTKPTHALMAEPWFALRRRAVAFGLN